MTRRQGLASRLLRPLLALILLAVAGALVYAAFPYVASAYYTEVGGRDSSNPVSALKNLQRAIDWQPDNAQAYRLMAQANRANGDLVAAVRAQGRYTELRPGNPVGLVELAELYEAIQSRADSMRLSDLLELFPGCQIEAPDVPIDTPYRQEGGPSWQAYVAETTFSLPPNGGDRPTLFLHPPSWVQCTLVLPSQPAVFRFDMGMDPRSFDWPGDGVTFEVLVDGERVFFEHLSKEMARRGWQRRTVSLASWSGQQIVLALGTTPGPVLDATGDWSGWGEPWVVDARQLELEALDPQTQSLRAWQKAGLTLQDFLEAGEAALQEKQYEAAIAWYRRAAWLEPELADPWYWIGRSYEYQEQWSEALEAYEKAAAAREFQRSARSTVYYRLGAVCQLHAEPRQLDRAAEAYEEALALNEFLAPRDLSWVHARLGQLYYERDRNQELAEAEILKALELTPEDEWLQVILGDFYRQVGRVDEAERMYEQALENTPGFEAAQERLNALRDGE